MRFWIVIILLLVFWSGLWVVLNGFTFPSLSITGLFTAPRFQSPTLRGFDANASCDSSLWNRVYTPRRLRVLKDCVSVDGTVAGFERESDGSVAIKLKVGEELVGLLNQQNLDLQGGSLVVRIVCASSVSREDVMQEGVCDGFSSSVYVPQEGERVRITGSFVLNTRDGWNEIQPVTAIETVG